MHTEGDLGDGLCQNFSKATIFSMFLWSCQAFGPTVFKHHGKMMSIVQTILKIHYCWLADKFAADSAKMSVSLSA